MYSAIAATHVGAEAVQVEVEAARGSDIVVIRSDVIDEKVVFHGPFVATSEEKIYQIIERYRHGEFGTLSPREEK
jgi:redox-sensitive bicupin YhaK (pirin superfamily)